MCKLAWCLSVAAWLGGVGVLAAAEKEAAGKQVEIQVVIADVAAKDRPGEEAIAQSAEKVLALVRQLEEQGKLEACSRVRLATLERQAATVQFGERRAVVAGRRQAPGDRGFSGFAQSSTMENLGVLVTATPEVAEDGSITVDLQIEKTRLSEPPANDARPDADAPAPRTLSALTRARVRIEEGQAVAPGGVVQSSTAKDQVSTLIVVTARTIGPDARRTADSGRRTFQVYALTYSHAATVLGTLKIIFDHKAPQMAVDERTNSLLVSGSDEEHAKVKAILQQLDAKAP
jgi:type II secretory pathway component GspD/PulD (secretin)